MPVRFYKEPVVLGFSVLVVILLGIVFWLWTLTPKPKLLPTVDRVRPTAGVMKHTMEYQFSIQESDTNAISSDDTDQTGEDVER